MQSLSEFYDHSAEIVKDFNQFSTRNSLNDFATVDHICYKCSSKESFEKVRGLLESESDYVYQSIISKRRIAVIKMKKAVQTILGGIFYLELSDQKPDGSQKEGFDHIEIVPKGTPYEELVQKLEQNGEKLNKVERPHHTTYDLPISEKFEVKLSQQPLVQKIKREEFQ